MTSNLRLGFDIGGTASRWVVCDADGHELTRGSASGATGHVFNPAEQSRLRSALNAVAEDLSARQLKIGQIVAGITGYGSTAEAIVVPLLNAVFGTEQPALVFDDMPLAYASVFAPGEGHLVSAGTGSIGLFIDYDGSIVRVGGRGILIDDAGSGSWIALRAIDRLFRHLDRTGASLESTPFGARLAQSVGGADWSAVREFVYGGDRGRIGKLALYVAQAADEGDLTAFTVLDEAGRELAALATALEARGELRPVALIGGILKLHAVVLDAIKAELPGRTLSFPQPDAALFAAQLFSPVGARWSKLYQAAPA